MTDSEPSWDLRHTIADWIKAYTGTRTLGTPESTIIPTWMWDELEEQDNVLFRRLRERGLIVRNQRP